jgi:hypothetical protein
LFEVALPLMPGGQAGLSPPLRSKTRRAGVGLAAWTDVLHVRKVALNQKVQ